MSEFHLGVIVGMLLLFGAQALVFLIVGMFRRSDDSNCNETESHK